MPGEYAHRGRVDQAGFPMKAVILEQLRRTGHGPIDLRTHSTAPMDYPNYALGVAEAIRAARPNPAFCCVAALWRVHCD